MTKTVTRKQPVSNKTTLMSNPTSRSNTTSNTMPMSNQTSNTMSGSSTKTASSTTSGSNTTSNTTSVSNTISNSTAHSNTTPNTKSNMTGSSNMTPNTKSNMTSNTTAPSNTKSNMTPNTTGPSNTKSSMTTAQSNTKSNTNSNAMFNTSNTKSNMTTAQSNTTTTSAAINPRIPVKNSDKYVSVIIDRCKKTKSIVGSPSFLRLQTESEFPPVEEDVVTIDTSKCRSNIDVVRKCVKDLGWREFPYGRRENCCDVYWNAVNFNESPDLMTGKVSKFPGTAEIFSKANLFRCLDVMKGLFPSEFDFYPKTWFLPQQFYQFNASVKHMTDKKIRPRPTFIVKPSDGSQGEGIYLLRDPANYCHGNKKHVVQEYLSNVLLIDDFKFDFRVYAVITSLDPLAIQICDEGLARFSTIPYEHPNAKNLQETFMHLTNYSLNKRSEAFDKSEKDNEGSKRKLTHVLNLLKRKGYDSEGVWLEIEQIVCKTILAVLGELKVEQECALPTGKTGLSCFQILGFDIILLKNLKPMLLEVNSNPSLRIDSETEVTPGVYEYSPSLKDEEVKRPLIRDTLMLVAPKHKFTRRRIKKKRVRPRQCTPEPTNQPTALVIMSETQDISERLLTFKINETASHNTPHRSEPNSQSDAESMTEDRSSNQNSAGSERTNENCSSDGMSESVEGVSQEEEADDNEEDEDDRDEEEEEEEEEDGEETANENEDEHIKDKEVDREPSCLKEIYPCIYGADFKHLHILEKMAGMFLPCIGVKSSSKLSSSGFRLFTRKCKLNGKGLTNATIDLIYIDMHRKHIAPDRGLSFAGFVEACHELARRKFHSHDKLEMMTNFLTHCQENIDAFNAKQCTEDDDKRTPLARKQKSRSVIFPQFTASVIGETTLHELYGQSLRKEYMSMQHKKINAYMAAHHRKTYKAGTRLNLKTNQDDT